MDHVACNHATLHSRKDSLNLASQPHVFLSSQSQPHGPSPQIEQWQWSMSHVWACLYHAALDLSRSPVLYHGFPFLIVQPPGCASFVIRARSSRLRKK
jgi:hypothetical protein